MVLTLNNFVFNCTHCLQTMGCAMAICVPSYASIFIARFEAKHIYPHGKEMSLLYLRYIDDIFMIWNDTKAELMTFIKELNEQHRTIKFDFQVSPRKIAFLAEMLYKDENNNIQKTLYRKPIDQQAFLHTKSENPRSLKSSIPYSQVLRRKTICSSSTEFDNNCAIIKQKFLDRQYKEETLDEQIKVVERIER